MVYNMINLTAQIHVEFVLSYLVLTDDFLFSASVLKGLVLLIRKPHIPRFA